MGVLTKCDRLSEEEREQGLARLVDAGVDMALCLSTTTGEGVNELLDWVRNVAPNE